MSHHKSNSDTAMKLRSDLEGRHRAPWVKWVTISTIAAGIATVVSAGPTIGMYCSHVAAVWHAPDQMAELKLAMQNLQSQQTLIQIQGQETREDVRDIKHLLYHQDRTTALAFAATNYLITP